MSAYERRDWRGAQAIAAANQSAYLVDDPVLALRDAAGVSLPEYKRYEFALKTALETLDSAVDNHRQVLKDLEEEAKKKKKKK